MNLYWVYDVPNWLFAVMVVAAVSAVGVAGLYLSRPWVRKIHQRERVNDVVSFYLAAVGVFYGITLGLLAVGTWQTYSEVETTANLEAAALAALYRDVSFYPDPARQTLKDQLREYTRYVIEEAWPMQRKGFIPAGGNERVNRFQETLYTFEPSTKGQEKIVNEALHQFNRLVELRRLRLRSVNAGLPGTLWSVIIFGALLNIAVTWLFYTESFTLHFWLTVLMCVLLGLLIHLVAAVDNPYRGEYSVDAGAYELVYESLMKKL